MSRINLGHVVGSQGSQGVDGSAIYYSRMSWSEFDDYIDKSFIRVPDGHSLKLRDLILDPSGHVFQIIDVEQLRVKVTYLFSTKGSIGPQGPQGEAGPEGPQGPQGPKGDDGTWEGIVDEELSTTSTNPVENRAIGAIVPAQASSSNQLADKAFVNSSIGTNTANYISNAGQPFTSLAQLQAYTGTVTNNDYAFVTGTDSAGNTYFDRYKATVNGSSVTWAKEYRLNNSSFTAAQWAAISSGITGTKVTNYDNHLSATNNPHSVTKSQVGLGNVNNTSDANKPISTATQTALNNKVDKVTGKGLSTNDYTTTEKNKLAGIASGAEVNVQSDWNTTDTSADSFIKNKPTIPSKTSDLTNDSDFVSDDSYVHTDNNYTNADKGKVNAILPTDAVLHYSFDEVPDLPDGVSIEKFDKNLTTDGWAQPSSQHRGTFSANNGILRFQQDSDSVSGNAIIRRQTFTYSDKIGFIVKVRAKVHKDPSLTNTIIIGIGDSGYVTQTVTEFDKFVDYYFVIPQTRPTSWTLNSWYIAVNFSAVNTNNYFEIEELYLGNGSYNTPIIDNANGQYNATNNGGLATEGLSGKAIKFVSANQYIQNSNNTSIIPNSSQDISLSIWVKISTDYTSESGVYKPVVTTGAYAGTFGIVRSAGTIKGIARDSSYQQEKTLTMKKGEWVHYVMVYRGNSHRFEMFENGFSQGLSNANIANYTFGTNTNYWRIWSNQVVAGTASTTTNQGAEIDDFQIFNRALSEEEVLGLYLAKGNTPKYYIQPTATQIQSDWNQSDTSAKDFIKNKPTIPQAGSYETFTPDISSISRVVINTVTGKRLIQYDITGYKHITEYIRFNIAIEAGKNGYITFESEHTHSGTSLFEVFLSREFNIENDLFDVQADALTGTGGNLFSSVQIYNKGTNNKSYLGFTLVRKFLIPLTN